VWGKQTGVQASPCPPHLLAEASLIGVRGRQGAAKIRGSSCLLTTCVHAMGNKGGRCSRWLGCSPERETRGAETAAGHLASVG
jgi:hypothetical protein